MTDSIQQTTLTGGGDGVGVTKWQEAQRGEEGVGRNVISDIGNRGFIYFRNVLCGR